MNISLLYTDSNKETESKALASFLVPEFVNQWAKFALEIQDDNVVLYFRCTRFATRQVIKYCILNLLSTKNHFSYGPYSRIYCEPFCLSNRVNFR